MIRMAWSCFVYGFARVVVTVFFTAFTGIVRRGSENVPREGACILASNHASFLDPPLVASGSPRSITRFLARNTLFDKVFLGSFLRAIQAIPVDRDRGDISAMRSVLRALKEDSAVALFPEGTRTYDGQLQEGKRGIGFLISKSRVPVIPAYIGGTHEALPRGAKRPRRHPVSITFGKPMAPEEFDLTPGDEDYARITAMVMKRIAALRDQAAVGAPASHGSTPE